MSARGKDVRTLAGQGRPALVLAVPSTEPEVAVRSRELTRLKHLDRSADEATTPELPHRRLPSLGTGGTGTRIINATAEPADVTHEAIAAGGVDRAVRCRLSGAKEPHYRDPGRVAGCSR